MKLTFYFILITVFCAILQVGATLVAQYLAVHGPEWLANPFEKQRPAIPLCWVAFTVANIMCCVEIFFAIQKEKK